MAFYKKTTISQGENRDIKTAHGMNRMRNKIFDKYCITKAKTSTVHIGWDIFLDIHSYKCTTMLRLLKFSTN